MASGLTQQQKNALRTSWNKYQTNGITNGTAFYLSWFDAYPEVAPHFKSLFKDQSIKDPSNGPNLRAQARVFNDAMSSYIDSLDDVQCLKVLVTKLTKNHVNRGLKIKEFQDAYGHFVHFLQKEQHIDGPTKEAWEKFVAVILQIMTERMK